MTTQGKHSRPTDEGSVPTTAAQPSRSQAAEKRRRKRRLSNILLVIGVALLIGAAVGFGFMYWEYKDGADRYDKVYDISGVKQAQVEAIAQGEEFVLDVDWDALREVNSDVVGWISIPGIDPINYPVVQGPDNEVYLNKSYDGDPGKYGSIFMDSDCAADLSDVHTVIYGHHLRNGEMFAQLANYTDQGFFDEHRTVIYATPEKTHVLKVIGAYASPATDDMRTVAFSTWDEYYTYVQGQLDRSAVSCDVPNTDVEHLYSLITCSYNTNDERTVVLCYEPAQ